MKPAWRSLRVVWSAAAPRRRLSLSAILRIRPIDVSLVDGLDDALCSLRVFMRRVRSALSRASIGGRQVVATQTAQNTTNAATATMIVKLFSEATRSIDLYLDGGDLVHDEDAQPHAD